MTLSEREEIEALLNSNPDTHIQKARIDLIRFITEDLVKAKHLDLDTFSKICDIVTVISNSMLAIEKEIYIA